MGGLGNQLFQLAAGFSLAKRHNTKLGIDLSWFNKQAGSTRRTSWVARLGFSENIVEPPTNAAIYHEGIETTEEAFFDLPNSTYLFGFFQNPSFFMRYYDEIITLVNIEKLVAKEELLPEQDSVAIHIRMGDYLTDGEIYRHHGFCGYSYYESALKRLSSFQLPCSIYTDNPNSFIIKKLLKNPNNTLSSPTKSEAIDLYRISKHKYAIIANSSFSLWAALINYKHKKIYYPLFWNEAVSKPIVKLNNFYPIENFPFEASIVFVGNAIDYNFLEGVQAYVKSNSIEVIVYAKHILEKHLFDLGVFRLVDCKKFYENMPKGRKIFYVSRAKLFFSIWAEENIDLLESLPSIELKKLKTIVGNTPKNISPNTTLLYAIAYLGSGFRGFNKVVYKLKYLFEKMITSNVVKIIQMLKNKFSSLVKFSENTIC